MADDLCHFTVLFAGASGWPGVAAHGPCRTSLILEEPQWIVGRLMFHEALHNHPLISHRSLLTRCRLRNAFRSFLSRRECVLCDSSVGQRLFAAQLLQTLSCHPLLVQDSPTQIQQRLEVIFWSLSFITQMLQCSRDASETQTQG